MDKVEIYKAVKKIRKVGKAAEIACVHRNTVSNVMIGGMTSAKEEDIIQACNILIVEHKINQVKRMEKNKEAILREIQSIAL